MAWGRTAGSGRGKARGSIWRFLETEEGDREAGKGKVRQPGRPRRRPQPGPAAAKFSARSGWTAVATRTVPGHCLGPQGLGVGGLVSRAGTGRGRVRHAGGAAEPGGVPLPCRPRALAIQLQASPRAGPLRRVGHGTLGVWKELGDPVHAGAAAGPWTFCNLAGFPGLAGSPGWIGQARGLRSGQWSGSGARSLKHPFLDSLRELEFPPDLSPYLAGCAPVGAEPGLHRA